jgi:hypothetical protein
MATIVNTTPAAAESDSSSWSGLLSVILVIAFIVLMLYYGLPALRSAGSGYGQSPQINVPGKVDVNMHQQK